MTLLEQQVKGRERFEGVLTAASSTIVIWQRTVVNGEWYTVDVDASVSSGNTSGATARRLQAAGAYTGVGDIGTDVDSQQTKMDLNTASTYFALIPHYGGIRGFALTLSAHATQDLQYVVEVVYHVGW